MIKLGSTNVISRIRNGSELITLVKSGNTVIYPDYAGFGIRTQCAVSSCSPVNASFGNYYAYSLVTAPATTGVNGGDSRISLRRQSVSGRYVPYLYSNTALGLFGLYDCYADIYFPVDGGIRYGIGLDRPGFTPVVVGTQIFGGYAGVTYRDVKLSGNNIGFSGTPSFTKVYPFLFDVSYGTTNVVISNISWCCQSSV